MHFRHCLQEPQRSLSCPPVLAPVLRPLCILNMPEMRSHRLRREFVTILLEIKRQAGGRMMAVSMVTLRG